METVNWRPTGPDRWLFLQQALYLSAPPWVIGGRWYRGAVYLEQARPPRVLLRDPDSDEVVEMLGTSIDWERGDGGPLP